MIFLSSFLEVIRMLLLSVSFLSLRNFNELFRIVFVYFSCNSKPVSGWTTLYGVNARNKRCRCFTFRGNMLVQMCSQSKKCRFGVFEVIFTYFKPCWNFLSLLKALYPAETQELVAFINACIQIWVELFWQKINETCIAT